jgi:hypothetical protein
MTRQVAARPRSLLRTLATCLLLAGGLAACGGDRGDAPAERQPPPGGGPTAAPGRPVAALADVVETTPRYIIGITYPKGAARYPALAAELQAYAAAARKELMAAVESAGDRAPTPYDLSLSFMELLDTPRVYAVAVDGTSYTGGAHGAPLVARWVWLPERGEMLTAQRLVATPAGWAAISAFVREQLQTALSQRLDAEEVAPEDRAEAFRNGSQMIEAGTAPKPAVFAQFEPVGGEGGALAGLRFVFPPYQVGPYSDGTQRVEVPAAVLLPHVAPAYRGLFQGGEGATPR